MQTIRQLIQILKKVNAMDELSAHQKEQLTKTLKKFPDLFSGGLGTIDIEPIHLEIEEEARLTQCQKHLKRLQKGMNLVL